MRVARTAGMWVGRARRFVTSVKSDIDRELAAEELKKALTKQAESEGLYDIIEDTRKSISPDNEPSSGSQEDAAGASPDKSHDRNG